ncbi:MAG TPA: hypothetical protein VMT45_08570, partial [Thermoanaerobaculaceae bacterium]|nr:hypothetical protein [Thermoanaerobaculaceae bacterium]
REGALGTRPKAEEVLSCGDDDAMLVAVVFVMPLESTDRRARRRAVSNGRRVLVVTTVFNVD